MGLKGQTAYLGVAALVVVAILAVGFVVTMSPNLNSGSTSSSPSSGSTSESASVQAGNQTYIATYVSSLSTPVAYSTSSTSSASTSSSTTSATSTQSLVNGGSFTYISSSQVKILSVAATVSNGVIGFNVQFENIGSNPMYVLGGGGSSLSVAITSGASNVKQVSSPRCEIVEAMFPVNPGQTGSADAPGCWSGYYYQLVGSATIQVQLTLTWSGSTSQATGSGSLTIDAEFTLS